MKPNPRPLHAVLRLRTLAPHGINETQIEVVGRLRRLEADGRIADLDVDVWGASMGMIHTTDRGLSGVRETVAEFERWADENDRTLRPAFGRRTVHGSEETRAVLPLLCLAVYRAGELRAVYPHVEDETVHTIHDGLDALESAASRTGSTSIRPSEGTTLLRP